MQQDTTYETEVLIAGAGPTGLVLAIELARRGVRHRIVERSERGFPGSRGTGLQPRTLELFDDLGVIDAVLRDSVVIPLMQKWEGRQRMGTWQLSMPAADSPTVPYRDARMLPQWRTVELLCARLEELGGRIDFGTELTGFTQDADGVTATLTGPGGAPETVRAGWLVAADGGRSSIRKELGVPFTGETLMDGHSLVADVLLDGPDRPLLDREHWHMWSNMQGALVGLRPLEGTDAVQVVTGFRGTGDEPVEGRDTTPEALTRLICERTQLDLTVREVRWASVFRLRSAMADRFREGRVLLAGDAAHVHPPTGGQGLNTSVQDAYNLGWKLAALLRGAPEALLDSYDAERRRVAADVLALSAKVLRADLSEREAGMSTRGEDTHQLKLGYPGSALSRELRRAVPEGALRAGDRAPDAPCTDPSGAPVRLFDVFRGPHFTLLDVTGAAAALPEAPWLRTCRVGNGPEAGLRDAEGVVKSAYGSGYFLVRPDGYVALATDDVADVTAYAREWLGAAGAAA
ncbi:hypothetical protein GCM10010218_32330 [Streptomyces mashuensis]|uniref:FAD-binding domain-containing protein n=1 Tax=Streptomyces mashuensis TaxID=33904 RepID=A0A919EDF0_9ACTN|nr:FAD-dependent monooxygenase [Streptomyces mashuensis]GHF48379.1 hypothetical protein GCM10010218_32330 [Streptomyces mashuensis]